MNTTKTIRFGVVALALLLLGSPAVAQTPARSFAELQPVLKSGGRVIVTDAKGVKTTGRVLSVVSGRLEIEQRRLRLAFSEDSVRQIEEDDSEWNGTLIGSGVGVLLGIAAARNPGPQSEGEELSLLVLGIVLGPAIGGGIDGMMHRSLYISPRKSSLSIVPLFGRGRIGVAATIRR